MRNGVLLICLIFSMSNLFATPLRHLGNEQRVVERVSAQLNDRCEQLIETHRQILDVLYQRHFENLKDCTDRWNGWAMVFVGALATIFGALLPLFFQWCNSRTIDKAQKLSRSISRELAALETEKMEFKAELYFNIARTAYETYRMSGSISCLYNVFVQLNKCMMFNDKMSDASGVFACAGFLNAVHMTLSAPSRSADKVAILKRMSGFKWNVSQHRVDELIDSASESSAVKSVTKGFYKTVIGTYS